MHYFAKSKIQEYNIPTSNRSCYKNFMWDGKTLALTCHKLIDNKLIEYKLSTLEILHEIAHFVVASEKERSYPEYGCGYLFLHGANGNLHSKSSEAELHKSYGILSPMEQDIKETAADLLSCYWAVKHCNILLPKERYPFFKLENGPSIIQAQVLLKNMSLEYDISNYFNINLEYIWENQKLKGAFKNNNHDNFS